MPTLRLALAQINSTVGDIDGNADKILNFAKRARAVKADIVIFPELAITGYPPEDLLLKPKFISDNLKALKKIEQKVGDMAVVAGFVDQEKGSLYNAAAFIHLGKTRAVCHKTILPNYGVFDEKRYFTEGKALPVFTFNGARIGLGVCEDIWHKGGPASRQIKGGKTDIIININSSPYHAGKLNDRLSVIKDRLKEGKANIVYVNMVGGQDELIFDGGSLVVDKKGSVVAMGKQFEEDLVLVDIPLPKDGKKLLELKPPIKRFCFEPLSPEEEVYRALTLAVRDYVGKNGFKKVLIGISGGVDSAITAVIASDAIGKENVNCVFMPSEFTSERSREDALALVKNLGINIVDLPINRILEAYLFDLSSEFKGLEKDIAEENLQARIRGNLLMALSNKFGWLVLTTGNKSEMSVGYATLYGDMAGGYAVLKDIPKTLVYRLSNWRNKKGAVIPQSIIDREPTAELKPNQKDQDVLPLYDVLDPIIDHYVVDNMDYKHIVRKGFPADTVKKVIKMIDHAEYKRRQSPPGPKITHRAFGKDWRLPITNLYKG